MDVNKLKHVLTDLKTLSDVVDKEVVKKMYMIIGSKNLIPLILPDLLLLKKQIMMLMILNLRYLVFLA